jgi:hypothetical protein
LIVTVVGVQASGKKKRPVIDPLSCRLAAAAQRRLPNPKIAIFETQPQARSTIIPTPHILQVTPHSQTTTDRPLLPEVPLHSSFAL